MTFHKDVTVDTEKNVTIRKNRETVVIFKEKLRHRLSVRHISLRIFYCSRE